jgi:hypothetical protein
MIKTVSWWSDDCGSRTTLFFTHKFKYEVIAITRISTLFRMHTVIQAALGVVKAEVEHWNVVWLKSVLRTVAARHS